MQFIYHGVPEIMIGTELISLNEMRVTMSKLRNENLKKYEGRKEILERKIPLLNCFWNDVVQFLPLNPQKIFGLQKSLGLISRVPNYRYYKIDLSKLEPAKTVVFFKTKPGESNTEVKWVKDVDFDGLQAVPQATADYYKSLINTGKLPFNYQFTPHIVYRGRLDVSDASIITLINSTD